MLILFFHTYSTNKKHQRLLMLHIKMTKNVTLRTKLKTEVIIVPFTPLVTPESTC